MGFAKAQPAVISGAASAVPPGPRGWSFLWRLLRNPDGWLDFLTACQRQYGNLVYFRFLSVPACLINDPAGIERVLVTDNQSFSKSMDYRALSRVPGQGLLTSEGEFRKRQRRLVQPAFFRDRILSYGGLMTSYTKRLIESWQDGEVRDVGAAGKSFFGDSAAITGLVKAAESAEPVPSIGGKFVRTVDAGRVIGTDVTTGQATSVYTVVTDARGEFVTAFPGNPRRRTWDSRLDSGRVRGRIRRRSGLQEYSGPFASRAGERTISHGGLLGSVCGYRVQRITDHSFSR